jgi:hypothetical protein
MKFEFPPEGLKLVCIVGMYEGKPIWRQVGKLTVSKAKGTPVVLLDPTFNPAGIHRAENNSGQVMVHAVEFSDEELEKKRNYQQKHTLPKPHWNDIDDDMPF